MRTPEHGGADWERLLAAERHVQHLIPGTVLVGGTAAALHLAHRFSAHVDHVLSDLRERFDEVLAALESAAGWKSDRLLRPTLILGQMDGMLTGIRQMRRTRPLETEVVEGLCVPTLAEMARIKAWLLATRHTVRDYLDLMVLLERLGGADALASLDEIYSQPSGASVLAEVAERLSAAAPADRGSVELATYKGLRAPWNDWEHLSRAGRRWAPIVARLALGETLMTADPLEGSRALWNRSHLNLESDETLAQLMDRGEIAAWRELYALARSDARLRERMHRVVLTAPLALPHFWLALLAGLGESVDYDATLPAYDAGTRRHGRGNAQIGACSLKGCARARVRNSVPEISAARSESASLGRRGSPCGLRAGRRSRARADMGAVERRRA